MDLLSFAKSLGAKIFGAAGPTAAPPEPFKEEAGKHDLDVAQVEVKSEGDDVVLSGNAASTEEAEQIASDNSECAASAGDADQIASDNSEGAVSAGDAEQIAPAIDDPVGAATVQNDIAAAGEAPESKG